MKNTTAVLIAIAMEQLENLRSVILEDNENHAAQLATAIRTIKAATNNEAEGETR